jgi:hypothetical protein
MRADQSEGCGWPAGGMSRYWVAFWLLGLCNNYPYVIMLSAAAHILEGACFVGSK